MDESEQKNKLLIDLFKTNVLNKDKFDLEQSQLKHMSEIIYRNISLIKTEQSSLKRVIGEISSLKKFYI